MHFDQPITQNTPSISLSRDIYNFPTTATHRYIPTYHLALSNTLCHTYTRTHTYRHLVIKRISFASPPTCHYHTMTGKTVGRGETRGSKQASKLQDIRDGLAAIGRPVVYVSKARASTSIAQSRNLVMEELPACAAMCVQL